MLSSIDTRLGIIGSSPAMLELKDYLTKAARSDATVLVTGETGTGKERIAAALHDQGPRAGSPFVAVNCAALPETLVESELFGHGKGAFTGAQSDFPGRFVEADGGTLFLDEIGELPLSSQAKLLRVLEDHQVTPVGSTRRRTVDVRLVAATNEELEERIAERRFRSDLYYRINVVRIELPPLREHPEDIEPIIDHFIAQHNHRRAMRVGRPDDELRRCLARYDWPGNVRELRNMVEALFVDPPDGRAVHLADLPANFRRLFAESPRPGVDERERLVEVLRETRWNKVAAAQRLNWSRMTLYRKLAKYHLDNSDGPL